MIKSGTAISESEELQKALAKITQLKKEKAVLTELSNRLRAELSKAGIENKRPVSTSSAHLHSDHIVQNAVRSKLDQLEKMQYQLTKADIQQAVCNESPPKDNKENSFPKPRHSANQVQGKQQMPSLIEQHSSGSSSYRPKAKAVALQGRGASKPKYQAPAPKVKATSNLAWRKTLQSKKDATPQTSIDEAVRRTNGNVPVRESTGLSALDSLDLGSSIQEVWRLLDEQPSINSSTQS